MNWLTFVGEGRSGHTIISAILGSHPNARIGEEQKYVSKWYRENWTKDQILQHLFHSGVGRAREQLDFPGILTYKEPLQVIGDKAGWDAVNEYKKRGAPIDILTQFGKHMGMPVKTIVSLRHPLDNISAWVVSPKYIRMYSDDNLRCRRMIRRYKRFYDAAVEILRDQDIHYLHNEELIANPIKTISSLANWLNLPLVPEWLSSCAKRVFKQPNQRRKQFDWPKEYEKRVFDYIENCPLLGFYR